MWQNYLHCCHIIRPGYEFALLVYDIGLTEILPAAINNRLNLRRIKVGMRHEGRRAGAR
jgi:hypothetical protein